MLYRRQEDKYEQVSKLKELWEMLREWRQSCNGQVSTAAPNYVSFSTVKSL